MFPFLAIGAVTALAGAYKGYKAVSNNNDANRINDSARATVRKAERRINTAKEACQQALADLGQRKADALRVNMQRFISTYSQIKNVDLAHDGDLGNLSLGHFGEPQLQAMRQSVSFVLSSGLGAGGGAVSGALTAFGAYSGTMAFATASTGTAISTLSGAAATNATLAWLGGGTLASGGMGIAGGMMALSAIATGPALLVAGWYMGAKAESKLNDAYSNLEQAKAYAADMDAAIALTDGITAVTKKASDILSELRKHSRRNVKLLQELIEQQGVDYTQYDEGAKKVVMKNVKIAQLMKAVIDTPILDEQGSLLGDAEKSLLALHQCIQSNFQGKLPA